MSDVGIVVLAAGGSTRMGRPKQLLPIEGTPMIRRAALAAVGSGCAPTVVVLGAEAEALRAEMAGLLVSVVVNDAWEHGLGTSIRCGIQALMLAADFRAAVILLCDQPLVSADAIRRLVSAHHKSAKPISVSSFAGAFGPPVVVDSEYFDLLLRLPDNQGAKALWAGNLDRVHFEPCPEAAIDIDTPGDYEKFSPFKGEAG